MVPAKLIHSQAKHVVRKDKLISFLESKFGKLNYSQTNLTSFIKGEDGNVCVHNHTKSAVKMLTAVKLPESAIMPFTADSFVCAW
jgi:hypothetical protein